MDLISREAALDAVRFAELGCEWELIEALPSAEPEIIRCKNCKYAEIADTEDSQDGYTCQFHRGSIWFSGSYCSWAERKNNAESDQSN